MSVRAGRPSQPHGMCRQGCAGHSLGSADRKHQIIAYSRHHCARTPVLGTDGNCLMAKCLSNPALIELDRMPAVCARNEQHWTKPLPRIAASASYPVDERCGPSKTPSVTRCSGPRSCAGNPSCGSALGGYGRRELCGSAARPPEHQRLCDVDRVGYPPRARAAATSQQVQGADTMGLVTSGWPTQLALDCARTPCRRPH
jgi:hypothetical protein